MKNTVRIFQNLTSWWSDVTHLAVQWPGRKGHLTPRRQTNEVKPWRTSSLMMELSYQSIKIAHQAREAVSEPRVAFCVLTPVLKLITCNQLVLLA